MGALAGPVLNSDEAATYCGYRGGGRSMRNLKARGVGPKWHRLGAILVYYPADLDEWIAAKKKPEVAASGLNTTSGEKFVREGV